MRAVLATVSGIPPGRVTTYAAVARAVGAPRAARAVGNALHQNPRPVAVPCHRVVRSDGSPGGYVSGVRKKRMLLIREGVCMIRGRIAPDHFLSLLA